MPRKGETSVQQLEVVNCHSFSSIFLSSVMRAHQNIGIAQGLPMSTLSQRATGIDTLTNRAKCRRKYQLDSHLM